MFATLLGGLPRPPVDPGTEQTDPPADGIDADVTTAVRAQEEAGLEPITDGRLRDPGFERLARALGGHAGPTGEAPTGEAPAREAPASASIVEGWRAAAARTDRAVKQALPGPYTLARGLGTKPNEREKRTLELAEALAVIVTALAAAGCPLVEIEEAEAHLIGGAGRERRLFREAHRRLTDGAGRGSGTHLSLSIVGGSAAGAGVETILDAPYASLAVDLIAGPDNWHLVRQAPSGRGVIAGVLAGREAVDEPREIMLWAAHYAASAGGRGPVRVGLGSAGSYANLTWVAAVRKMRRLGEAARLAEMPPSLELARQLDPRAVSIRTAALGHDAPPPPRRRTRKGG